MSTLYTPGEMVRLELLQYQNPEGLHQIEEAWRDLARKLMQSNIEMQKIIAAHGPKLSYDKTPCTNHNYEECNMCKQYGYFPFKFPEAFKPVV